MRYASDDDAIAACDANDACVGYKYKGYGDKPYVLCRQFHAEAHEEVVWKHPNACRHPDVENVCGPRHPNGTFVESGCADAYREKCAEWTCAAP